MKIVKFLTLVTLAVYVGCDRPPARVQVAEYNPSAGSEAIREYDANKDGKISGAELNKTPALKASLNMLRTDANKGVTAEMISNRIKTWQDSKIGRVSIRCTVLHNGMPLAGADIKFVPDSILGTGLLPATGKTAENGMVSPTLPVETSGERLPAGAPPGFYRVEITKSGENIPLRYNTATTLGQEVSVDNPIVQGMFTFDLKY